MSLTIDIKMRGLEELVGGLKAFEIDQLPYALSLGMNRAAKDAVFAARAKLPGIFDLRAKSLGSTFGPYRDLKGASPAQGWSNKSQWPNLQVVFFNDLNAMALQETGGTKPFKGSEVWIDTKHIARTKGGRKLARHQPAALKKRLAAKSQRGPTRIFDQGGTVFERTKATGEVLPLYIRRPTARVAPALGFETTVSTVFDRKLPARFSQAMDSAMRTRRPR